MKRRELTDQLRAELLQEEMLRIYFAGRGYRISKTFEHRSEGIVVHFPEGGPHRLRKYTVSRASLRQIAERILSQPSSVSRGSDFCLVGPPVLLERAA